MRKIMNIVFIYIKHITGKTDLNMGDEELKAHKTTKHFFYQKCNQHLKNYLF